MYVHRSPSESIMYGLYKVIQVPLFEATSEIDTLVYKAPKR